MSHQQRVIKEKQELDSNIGKLHEFIKSGNENVDELHREQLRHMRSYSAVLGQRITGFGEIEAVEEAPLNMGFDPAFWDTALPTETVVIPLFRAKLKVLQVIPDEEYETVVMASEEDPAAELTMAITNPELHGKIQPGHQFYVDFTEAGVVEPVEEESGEL